MKNPLVEVKYNKVFCISNTVGEEFNIAHNEILRKIDNFTVEIPTAELKTMYIEAVYINSKGREYRNFHMSRKGYMFLVMNISTKGSNKKKLAFIDAFDMMEDALRKKLDNKSDIEWNQTRLIGKQARLEETDAIKLYAEYCTEAGSKNAQMYYKHITNATYRALGFMAQKEPKLRDQMNIYEVSQLMLAEKLACNKLIEYMELKREYHDIFKSVKEDLLKFADAVRLN